MKSARIIGLILIVLGVIALAIPVFRYTEREEVLKLGPISATANVERSMPIPPAVGWALLASGIVVFAVSFRGR